MNIASTRGFRNLLDEIHETMAPPAPRQVLEQVADLLEPIVYLAKTAAAIDWENALP